MKSQKLKPDPSIPYQKMYVTLFKAVTAALYLMEGNEVIKARAPLTQARQRTEELYIEGEGGDSPTFAAD